MTERSRYRVEALAGQDKSGFTCGEPELDRYLRERAGQDQRRYVANCFVFIDRETDELLGYYTLSAAALAASDLPAEFARKLPRYANLPAILLGRLAVSSRHQRMGHGRRLLTDALRRARESTIRIAAMAVVVDAKHDAAAAFYEALGFTRFASSPNRLYLPIASIPHEARSPLPPQ